MHITCMLTMFFNPQRNLPTQKRCQIKQFQQIILHKMDLANLPKNLFILINNLKLRL